ncbi:MAG: polyprenyl synthetase family protein [Dehalococcoidales bacterium]|nr:polyprenyl synthetase family protein [Dehalococcoidales bacterium]
MQLTEIYQPIVQELEDVEDGLKAVSVIDAPWMEELLAYALKGGGKRLRPALAIFSAKFYDFDMPRLLPLTTSVELMHMATLVHDDTIDKSNMRWGRETINKLWGMEKAILLGDYLFAKAGALTASTENLRVIKLLSETLMVITNGELAQSASAFALNQSREHYYFRISCKTAALFVMATESGAVLSNAPEKSIKILHDYGYNLGVAFQIIDDILDYIGTEKEMGKPVGSDLAQGTLTLPGLMLVEKYPLNNPVQKLFADRKQTENIAKTIEMVRNSDIIGKCFDIAAEYKEKACRGLRNLPANESRESLYNLADFIVNRRR